MFRKTHKDSAAVKHRRFGTKKLLVMFTIFVVTVFMSACSTDLFEKIPFLSDLQSAVEDLVPTSPLPFKPVTDATRPHSSEDEQSGLVNYHPVLTESSQRYLTADDVEHLSTMERLLARCEIFARHGVIFNDETLASLFENQTWYQGTIPESSFDQTALNEFESANLQLIEVYDKIARGEYEASFNNPYLQYYDPSTELIVPHSNYQKLTENDLAGLTEEQVILLRNQIIAMHGYTFSDQFLMEYFLKCSWYRPSTPPGRADLVTGMTNLEDENMSFINRYEASDNDQQQQQQQIPTSQVTDTSILGTWCSGRGSYTDDGLFSVCFGDYWHFQADGTFTSSENESVFFYNPDGTEHSVLGVGGLASKGVFSFDGTNLTVTTTHCFETSSGPYVQLNPYWVSHATVSYDGDVMLVNWGGHTERFYRETGDALVKRLMREQSSDAALDLSKLDKTLNYSLSSGIFSVSVPAYWREYAVITTSNVNGLPALGFCEAPDYGGYGGHLFTLYCQAPDKELSDPVCTDLGVISNGTDYLRLIARFPSDVQFTSKNKDLYYTMNAEYSRILGTLCLADGYSFVEYNPSSETD